MHDVPGTAAVVWFGSGNMLAAWHRRENVYDYYLAGMNLELAMMIGKAEPTTFAGTWETRLADAGGRNKLLFNNYAPVAQPDRAPDS